MYKLQRKGTWLPSSCLLKLGINQRKMLRPLLSALKAAPQKQWRGSCWWKWQMASLQSWVQREEWGPGKVASEIATPREGDGGSTLKRLLSPLLLGCLWCMVCAGLEGFPGGASGKEPACQCRRHKRHGFSLPGSGRSPGGSYGNPVQYTCLENPMDRGAYTVGYTVPGVAELDTTEHACTPYQES